MAQLQWRVEKYIFLKFMCLWYISDFGCMDTIWRKLFLKNCFAQFYNKLLFIKNLFFRHLMFSLIVSIYHDKMNSLAKSKMYNNSVVNTLLYICCIIIFLSLFVVLSGTDVCRLLEEILHYTRNTTRYWYCFKSGNVSLLYVLAKYD